MSHAHGITKTIPKHCGPEVAESLYDGSRDEFEFHIAANLTRVAVGDWVYTILDNRLIGRCRITQLIGGAVNPTSGAARVLVMVECPGERLAEPIPMPGHRGTRYCEGDDWPG